MIYVEFFFFRFINIGFFFTFLHVPCLAAAEFVSFPQSSSQKFVRKILNDQQTNVIFKYP